MSELDEIRRSEEANYDLAVRLIGADAVSLVQDLLDHYTLLAQVAPKSRLVARDEFVTGLHFLLGARYHLTIGALATLRCHISDALRSGRMAIEMCAFAARIKRQPDLALAWLNAGDSDDLYDRYRRVFSGQKIFREDHPILRELGDRFDTTSKLSHPSRYALAEHTRFQKTEKALNVEFHYFTVKNDDPSEPTRTFFWTVDTHFGVLRIFEEVLMEALEAERARVDVQRNGIDAKLMYHKSRWKDVILRKASRPASPSPSSLVIIPKF